MVIGEIGADMAVAITLVTVVYGSDTDTVTIPPLLMEGVGALASTEWYLHVTLTNVQ